LVLQVPLYRPPRLHVPDPVGADVPAGAAADYAVPAVQPVGAALHLLGSDPVVHQLYAAAVYLDAQGLFRLAAGRPDRSGQSRWREPVDDHSPHPRADRPTRADLDRTVRFHARLE